MSSSENLKDLEVKRRVIKMKVELSIEWKEINDAIWVS